ncbi:MAG: hypothetical protein A2Z12_09030 [Actinobacteria bacterium RBG_16_68_21]|nr:MAG: hypothetical protein A2Z12_09030 [Actinobacteria bacterium RBG_16_68_21]
MIASVLSVPELRLFWLQPVADQHHAVAVAARVAAVSEDPLLVRAALLHDVGKRHSRTGTAARTVASVLAILHLPRNGKLRTYLEHGRLGGADLEAAGSPPIVVAFAEHHHGPRPQDVPAEAWALLCAADDD